MGLSGQFIRVGGELFDIVFIDAGIDAAADAIGADQHEFIAMGQDIRVGPECDAELEAGGDIANGFLISRDEEPAIGVSVVALAIRFENRGSVVLGIDRKGNNFDGRISDFVLENCELGGHHRAELRAAGEDEGGDPDVTFEGLVAHRAVELISHREICDIEFWKGGFANRRLHLRGPGFVGADLAQAGHEGGHGQYGDHPEARSEDFFPLAHGDILEPVAADNKSERRR